MAARSQNDAAGRDSARRLFVYNSGFLTQTRVRRILELSGYDVRLGLPGSGDTVGVWGHSPTAHRGETVASSVAAPVIRIEDAPLRSLFPGRAGEPPLGLVIDSKAVHFDPSQPSELEDILSTHPLDDTVLLDRARGAMARLRDAGLSKYSAFDTSRPAPAPGYVLVIDQTQSDASVTACGADLNRFREMLFVAQEEHPGAPILIKTHPETQQGFRQGYFNDSVASDRVSLLNEPINPWALFDGAIAVYTVSSQLGFEAIFAGHRPRLFGQPFYAGWGLTEDEFPVQRRQRKLTRAQLFAAAMILYPKWYDPYRDTLCELETAIETLAAQTRAWREDHCGWVASGMRLWKRASMNKVFGQYKPMVFEDEPARARAANRPWMVWATKADVGHKDAVGVEDGFLRSRGLGAELVPPLSLIIDDLGMYYDPSGPSRLEQLIAKRAELRPDQALRARRLIRSIKDARLSKYNIGTAPPKLPQGHRILVAGQVEDDASLLLGAGDVRTNRALLEAVRAAHPEAVIIYKPHPDVEVGLRPGALDATGLADLTLSGVDPALVLGQVDAVWTMTSLLGFEALVRGLPVTTLGVPFYAGWGLTMDRGPVPPRRRADPTLEGLLHAALIDYPRYFDPVTGQPCPVEVVVERLSGSVSIRPGRVNRFLSKMQGVLASHAHVWRP